LGYAKDEINFEEPVRLLWQAEEDVAFVQQELGSKGFVFDKPADFRTKESGIRQCVITVSKELDVKGEEYCQGIIHDITVLKKAEKASLALEKLKMAGRLLRAMAHEVRNPLSNIMLSVEQIRETSQETERGLFMNIIERNCLRINELISDLLNSSGGGELQVQKHALQSVLDETLEAAKDRINLQNIAVKKKYLDEEAWVMVDREKLKIAFLNIIINAIESMQKDKGQLLLSVEKKDDLTYAVVVEDNGCGIDNDNLIKLFEPYFTTKSNGIGLGLSSTLNILQSHNAAVDVESVLAKGTAFKISFTIA
jgi:signal transduction histidine kinase